MSVGAVARTSTPAHALYSIRHARVRYGQTQLTKWHITKGSAFAMYSTL